MTKTLYPLVAGAVPTRIVNDFVFDETAEIVVESVEDIPNAPNIVTIRDFSDAFITVKYGALTENTLSDLTYLEGDIEYEFESGTPIVRCYSVYDHEAIIEHIDTKVDKVSGSSLVPDAKVAMYDSHLIDVSNPHSVTKTQIGLGNVDNTSDLDKPISTLTQAALDDKTDVDDFNAHTTNKSNPHEVTKAQVGLGNVDNTSDADKVNTSGNPINEALAAKVDKVSGSSLVPDTKVSAYDSHIVNKSNPHEVTKAQVGLPNVEDGAQINVIESISKNGTAQTIVNKNVNLVLSKRDVGLGNVDNTSDADKPISDATQEALDDKVDKVSGSSLVEDTKVASYDSHLTNTSNPHSVTKSQVGLGNVDNTADTDKPVSTATQTELDKKVDKVTGSSLVPDTKVTAYDSHLTNTDNPHSTTKSQVGLENVDNTSDTTKANTEGNPVHDKIETKAPISHASSDTTYGIASASNYGHPKAASTAPSDATLAAAIGTDDGQYARADHSHAKETFTMNGITINSGDWVSDNTYSDYPYKATISNTSISSSHIPIVILSSDDAISGNICTVAQTADGTISIYARYALPCVISKIAFIKE